MADGAPPEKLEGSAEAESARPGAKVARIDGLDQPIHRIFPLWFFEEALRLKSIASMMLAR